jgi:MraZ protein
MDPLPKPPSPTVDPPLGTYSAKVDDRGRLKLPADFKEFLASFGDNRVFITSLDERTLQLYPIAVWRYNLEFLMNYSEDPEASQSVAIIANANGCGSVIDDQGRVLLPQDIRRRLNLENTTVHLDCYRNQVNIIGPDVVEERLRRARVNLEEKLATLKKAGFQ